METTVDITTTKTEEDLQTAVPPPLTANISAKEVRTTKSETTTITPLKNLPIELQQDQKRRSSSRSIKRKRFDDEIVEYSLAVQSRSGGNSGGGEQHRVGRPRTISQTHGTAIATTSPIASIIPTNSAASVTTLPPPTSTIPIVATTGNNNGLNTTNAPTNLIILPANTSVVTSSPTTIPADQQVSLVVGTNIASTKANTSPSQAQASTLSHKTVPATLLNTMSMQNNATSSAAAFSVERRRPPRATAKRSRKSGRPSNQVATKDLGRWKPIDDLALIIGVQQTNDLRMVHRGIKFSCRFTLQELQARWMSLLYEPAISRLAFAGIRNLHPEIIEAVQRKAIFSTQEEELLASIKSTDSPKMEQFQELLDKNASVFFQSRTAKSLQNHWHSMKQYQLLSDQVVKPIPVSGQPLSFSDAEDLILDAELNEQRDETLEIELKLNDRQQKREIRILENELTRWNVLVDSITGVGVSPEFDSQTLAILRGRLVRYLMRSKEITFGRDAKDCVVDVDLTLEGPSTKISRRQGTIKLRSNGDFFISNEGKRAVFINGQPLTTGNRTRLANNCVLEICGLRFVFLVNYELINAIRHESAKTTAPLN